eukprot:941780-Pleurochrysis_carterae.AAC.1
MQLQSQSAGPGARAQRESVEGERIRMPQCFIGGQRSEIESSDALYARLITYLPCSLVGLLRAAFCDREFAFILSGKLVR